MKWKMKMGEIGGGEASVFVEGKGEGVFGKWGRKEKEEKREKGIKRKGKRNKKEYSSFYFGIFLFIFITLTLNSPLGLPQFDS